MLEIRLGCKREDDEYLVPCDCSTKTLEFKSERVVVFDSERVAHDLERQAWVALNTCWFASAHRHQSLLFPDVHRAHLTDAGLSADPTPAFDNGGGLKTLCQISLTIPSVADPNT